jgi:hypothetical protein
MGQQATLPAKNRCAVVNPFTWGKAAAAVSFGCKPNVERALAWLGILI